MAATRKRKKKRTTHVRWVITAIAVVMVYLFFQTAPGVAALETVKETAANIIETLFPPKEIPVQIEGETEIKHQEAGGQEPEIQEDGTVTVPGFAIYYDTELYTMQEENGITYIRFLTDYDIPPCEVEIKHIPNVTPYELAETTQKQMSENWENVSEIMELEAKDVLIFSYASGMNWDSACGNVYFIHDGQEGCFQITSKYFVEAAEGHGARFSQMIQTFEIID